MALFRQILEAADLPVELVGYEAVDLDFKTDPHSQTFEMAKDVAAFANANGGVVLVGAAEDRSASRLGRYKLLNEQDAATAKRTFEEAVAERCIPRPFIDVRKLRHGDGFVLAVNVWPFPSQAVGVRVADPSNKEWGDNAYVFPLRVGTLTRLISPEQLPMLMLPEVRRVAVLLDAIPGETAIKLIVPGGHGELTAFAFKQMNILENTVTLIDMHHPSKPLFNVPLDSIRSVWRGTDLCWTILMAEVLINENGQWRIHPHRRD